jgi:hypothetical protein
MAVEKIDEFHFKYNERVLFLPLTFVSTEKHWLKESETY